MVRLGVRAMVASGYARWRIGMYMAHHDPQPKQPPARALALVACTALVGAMLGGCSSPQRPDGPPKASAYSTAKVYSYGPESGNPRMALNIR